VALVKLDEPLPHREVMIPAPELDRSAGQGVVAFDDGRIERDDDRGMNEVKQVGCGWPQALDALGFERADRLEHVGLLGAAITRMQQPSKGTLIVPVFVDIRNPQFGLPQERMVGPLEDLTLLGNRGHDRLERRSLIDIAEVAFVDLLDDLADSTPDRAEVLQSFGPQEPGLVGSIRVLLPAFNQETGSFRHADGRQNR
jgi:hypothetical protein